MKRLRLVCAAAVALATWSSSSAQYLHTRGTDVLDSRGQLLHLKGTNLGNWLVPEGYMWHFDQGPQSFREINELLIELVGPSRARQFWQQYRQAYISREDIHQIKAAGFNHIRIPFHWALFQSEDAEGFRLVDQVVEWCRQDGLLVILDMHAAPGGQTGTNIDDSDGYPWLYDDPVAQEQAISTWKRIARHYRNNPVIAGYDLLNEPIPNYPALIPLNPKLAPLQRRMSDAIRTVDKHHAIILGGAQWDQNLNVYDHLWDPNTILEVHRYRTSGEEHSIDDFLAQRSRLNAPLWMGETGENTDDWIARMRALLEKHDVGWCFWPYKKMDATTSPVTFDRPEGWEQIVTYAKLNRTIGAVKQRLPQRPSQTVIDHALTTLLENIRFDHERRNVGYIKALLPNASVQP